MIDSVKRLSKVQVNNISLNVIIQGPDRLCARLTKAELHKNDLGGIRAAVHLSSLSNDRKIVTVMTNRR